MGTIILYTGVLLVAGLTPPGQGFLGKVIAGLGSDLLSWLHVPAFAALCWLTAEQFRRRAWPLPYAWGAGGGCAFVFGLWLEVLQGSVEGRVTTSEDLFIDMAGIALACAAAACRSLILRQADRAPHRAQTP
jgi:hypothetical protein